MRIKEAIGIPLLCLFGKSVVLCLLTAIDSDHTIWSIAFIALSLIVCVAFFLMAKNKSAYIKSAVGQVAAYVLGAFHAVYAVNILLGFICEFNIFTSMGDYATLVDIVFYAMIVAYILSTKAWLPIKILGSPMAVFYLATSVLFLKVPSVTLDSSLYTAIGVCAFVALGLNVICLILTIVWMSSKNISSENRQSINMI